MKPARSLAAVGIAFAVWGTAARPLAAQPTADPLPSSADVQAAYDAGRYVDVLQMLNRLLVLKGRAAEPYDRHALVRLKAETHLRMKPASASAAAQAFAEAGDLAPDGPAAAQDIAAGLLAKRASAGLAYQPKRPDPADKTRPLPPAPIVDPADRAKAVELLYADELAALEPRLAPAADADGLKAIVGLLPTIRNVRWLEMAATGSDSKTREAVAGLSTRAQQELGLTVRETTETVGEIFARASQVVPVRVPQVDRATGRTIGFQTQYRRTGPTARQFAQLRDAAATCRQIHGWCDELGGTLGATGKEFDAFKIQAEQAGRRADQMLGFNWRETFARPPG